MERVQERGREYRMEEGREYVQEVGREYRREGENKNGRVNCRQGYA